MFTGIVTNLYYIGKHGVNLPMVEIRASVQVIKDEGNGYSVPRF